VPLLWSLLLVVPGLWLRSYASGYVKKNRELTQTGPYAYTRNPLYLGSMLMAAGFSVALMSWPFALTLAVGFVLIYVPVIASEEAFLSRTFSDFGEYCARVPRLIPRLTPAKAGSVAGSAQNENAETAHGSSEVALGSFSFELYRRHREYNSAIGAVFLYLSLLLAMMVHSSLGR
jgi:hypothetical protein